MCVGGAVSPAGHDFSNSYVVCILCVAMAAGKAPGFHFQDGIFSTDVKSCEIPYNRLPSY